MNGKSKCTKDFPISTILQKLNILLLASIKVGASREFINGIENSISVIKALE